MMRRILILIITIIFIGQDLLWAQPQVFDSLRTTALAERNQKPSLRYILDYEESYQPVINPSLTTLVELITTDREAFLERARAAERTGAGSLHVDIFDRRYVGSDNMAVFDVNLVEDLAKAVSIPLDVHLMVRPSTLGGIAEFERYIKGFIDKGARFVSVHLGAFWEDGLSDGDIREVLKFIQDNGACAGLVVNPDEGALELVDFQNDMDFALVMTVMPGADSRPFDERGFENLKKLRDVDFAKLVAVDGGVNNENIGELAIAGAKWFVVGSYYFGKRDKLKTDAQIGQAHESLIRASPPTLGREMVRIIAEVGYPGVKPEHRFVLTYPGTSINSAINSFDDSGLLRVIRGAPNEYTMADIAFGLSQLNKRGFCPMMLTHRVGTQPGLAEMSKWIMEGLPFFLICGGNTSNIPSEDGLHAGTHPADRTSRRDEDIRVGRVRRMEIFVLKTGKGQESLAGEFQKAVKTAVHNRRPVLVVIQPNVDRKFVRAAPPLEEPIREELPPAIKNAYTILAGRVLKRLRESRQAALHVGEGIPPEMAELVEKVSEELGIYMTTTWGARGLIRDGLKTNGGTWQGKMSAYLPRTMEYMEGADLVLRLGNRRIPVDFETGVGTRAFPKNTISIWPLHHYPHAQHIEHFLKELLRLAKESGWKKRDIEPAFTFVNQVMPDDAEVEALLDKNISSLRDKLHRLLSYWTIQRPHPKMPFYTICPGRGWFIWEYMVTPERRTGLSNTNEGELGPSAGQALAVSYATDNGVLPISIEGDGGYAQKWPGLIRRFVQENRGAAVMVFDNRRLKMGTPSGTRQQTIESIVSTENDINICEDARGAGAIVHDNITTPRQLFAALDEAGGGGVHIIRIPIDPENDPDPLPLRIYTELRARHRAIPVLSMEQRGAITFRQAQRQI